MVSTDEKDSRARIKESVPILMAVAMIAVLGVGDCVTGSAVSFTLLYVIPVALATWRGSRMVGIAVSLLAGAVKLVANLKSPLPVTTALWNSGMALGVFLSFCTLLRHIRATHRDSPVIGKLGKVIGMTVGLTVALTLAGFLIEHRFNSSEKSLFQGTGSMRPSAVTPARAPVTGFGIEELQIAQEEAMAESRAILLGSRSPVGESCVVPTLAGQVTNRLPTNMADYDGGPGTKLQLLLYLDRQQCGNALSDFAWHQGRLRMYLENLKVESREASESARDFADRAGFLAAAINDCQVFPPNLKPVEFEKSDDWPGYCMDSLNQAIAIQDLARAKHWAVELQAAAFAMRDLHNWLQFLSENYLAALEFQKHCADLFMTTGSAVTNYNRESHFGNYPAGLITINGNANFYEVEHQGERMFSMPEDRLREIAANAHWTSSSVWMPPATRGSFLACRGALSPANRETWDLAARTPYEHTYLVNMLYRAQQAGAIKNLVGVLRKFDAMHRHATVAELMSVLMYRGHSFAGVEWADRFQPQLMEAAEKIRGTDEKAFLEAARWVNRFYRTPAVYGVTFTLRDALESRRLDCIRATDMIAAVFRDAGCPKFGHVRWSAGTVGHSVAAYLGAGSETEPRTIVADGLNLSNGIEYWPEAYFRGHAWPPGLQNNPQPYAVELYVRGLDNYVWAEGYIVRGPNAGTLVKAAVPYLKNRDNAVSRKVFDGPYPQ